MYLGHKTIFIDIDCNLKVTKIVLIKSVNQYIYISVVKNNGNYGAIS